MHVASCASLQPAFTLRKPSKTCRSHHRFQMGPQQTHDQQGRGLAPVLLLLKGAPGSGKSTLAAAAAAALSWPLVDKDDARSPCQHLVAAHPSLNWNQLAYDVMWRVCERQLRCGLSVIVDCPLARRELFDRAASLAAQVRVWGGAGPGNGVHGEACSGAAGCSACIALQRNAIPAARALRCRLRLPHFPLLPAAAWGPPSAGGAGGGGCGCVAAADRAAGAAGCRH